MTVFAPETERNDIISKSTHSGITVVHGVLFLIAAAAAIMRLTALGALPLSLAEAEAAFAVWRFWQPGASGTPVFEISPAYFSLTALLLPVLGDSDLVVRLIPALFGIAFVLIPWLWRDRLGTVGALVTGILLAVSPSASMIAVTAGGDAIALAAILLLLVAWTRYQDHGRAQWLLATFAAIGLGLSSSPLFYSGIITLALAWLLQTKVGPALTDTPSLDGRGVGHEHFLRAILSGTIIFVALATLFLWRPAGLGAAATQLTEWLSYFSLQEGLDVRLASFLILGRYELIAVTFGAVAIFWASWRGTPLPIFLVYWFAAGLLLMLLQPAMRENIFMMVLPAYLLIGLWLNEAYQSKVNRTSVALLGILLLFGAVLYFNGARYLRVVTHNPAQLSFLFLALVAIAFAVVVVNFVRTWDKQAALQGTLTALLILFLIYNWGTARWLLHQGGNDPRARWTTVATDNDVLMLVDLLEEISYQITGAPFDLEIVSGVDNPVIHWYLRNFYQAQIGDTVPPETQAHAVITPVQEEPALGSDYFGTDLDILQMSPAQSRSAPDSSIVLVDTLRWWLFHEQKQQIETQKIILWVRGDGLQ